MALSFDEEVPTFVIVDYYYPATWLTRITDEACIIATLVLLTNGLSDLPNDLLRRINMVPYLNVAE